MTTTPRSRSRPILAFIIGAVLLVAAVLLTLIVGPRYLWNAQVESLSATDSQTGQKLTASEGVSNLPQGETMSLSGKTVRANTARIALRKDGSASNLTQLNAVAIKGNHFTVRLPQTAALPEGNYTVAVYLDGNNTIDDSVNFIVH